MLKQFGLLLIAWMSLGHARAASLKACMPDYPNRPFSSPIEETAGQRVVTLAVQRQGDDVQFIATPWARCLAGIQGGEYDLLMGAEPDEDLSPFVAFPQRAGKVDTSRRLGVIEYVVVQKLSSQLMWEGRAFKDLGLPVVVPRSIYAVSKRLASIGVVFKSLNYNAGRFAALLCHDRTEFIVVRRNDLPTAISGCPASPALHLQSFPLTATDVYLGVRRSLLQSRPELGEAIWRELAKIRSSNEWPPDLD
jgi:polar amino acid transport system substrate-binding protein